GPQCAHPAISGAAPTTTPQQTVLRDDVFNLDRVGNPLGIEDRRTASEWRDAPQPVASRRLTYDDAYRLTHIWYDYATDTKGDAFSSPVSAQTSYQNPVSIASSANGQRVRQQSFAFDFLGNSSGVFDDQSVFYDRSLGTVVNGP